MMCSGASCGTAKVDKLKKCPEGNNADIKLAKGTKSDVVPCSIDECQKDQSPKQEDEEACEKRAVITDDVDVLLYNALPDDVLFKQPESSYLGDCPICLIPLALNEGAWKVYGCCSKTVCNGCNFINQRREYEQKLEHACPFCRHLLPKSNAEDKRNIKRRINANDPLALCNSGAQCLNDKKFKTAFKLLSKAAELGDVTAHFNLSIMYSLGQVEKDREKHLYHLEQGSIGGHPSARYNLGNYEWVYGDKERAKKHYMISASLGCDDTIRWLMHAFKKGKVSKEYLAVALRAHQAAVNATKSPQREEAEEAMKRYGEDFDGYSDY